MRNKFRQNQRISKNLAVTTGQKDKMRERIQRKYFLWDNFLNTYVESWVEAKGWEVWGFLFEIFFVLLFVRVRCRKQRKRLSLQINSCKLSAGFFFLWNKAEQQEKRGRKEKKLNQCFRIALNHSLGEKRNRHMKSLCFILLRFLPLQVYVVWYMYCLAIECNDHNYD